MTIRYPHEEPWGVAPDGVPMPCPWRSAVQPLYPAKRATCPLCHEPVDEAEATVEYALPRMVAVPWWQRVAALVFRQPQWASPWLGREVEQDRVGVFLPCGCAWRASVHPWADLLCVVTDVGMFFRMVARDKWERAPQLRMVNQPGRLHLPQGVSGDEGKTDVGVEVENGD